MKVAQSNVAVVEPVGGHGGCTYYDFALCRALRSNGFDATLYTCDKTDVSGAEGFPIERSYVGIYGSDPAWKRGLRFLKGSVQALVPARWKGAKIAHFHFYHVGALELFNVLLARVLGMRIVVTAHDVEAFKEGLSVKRFVRWAYGMADAVIAHNNISRQELIDQIGLPAAKIHVIKHGNHADYVRSDVTRDNSRQKYGLESDDFVIVFFGQIKEVKGVDVLLKAMPLVKAQVGKRVRLLIAGKVWKDDFSKYQALIDQHQLGDVVQLHIRYVPDEELPYFYAAADVMALPYKRIYQSGVVLMAMSFGKPVLVSNIAGMTEVVTDGVTGLVFRTEDPDDMARQLIEASRDPARLARIADQGRELMMTEYAWSKIGAQTAACYRALLN